jgi:hypothetical protein
MTERRVVTALDVRSVVRMTMGVSLSLWAIVFVGVIALFVLGLVSGGLGGVEGFIASLGFTGFRFTILPFLVAFIALALLFSVVLGMLAAIAVLLYNALVPILGGVEVRTRGR